VTVVRVERDPLRFGPVLVALLVAGWVGSFASAAVSSIVGPATAISDAFGAGSSRGRPTEVAAYLLPLVVTTIVGALVLPWALDGFAGVEITVGEALVVLAAGETCSIAARYLAGLVIVNADRFGGSTPDPLSLELVYTWGSWLVGAVGAWHTLCALVGPQPYGGARRTANRGRALSAAGLFALVGIAMIVASVRGDLSPRSAGRDSTVSYKDQLKEVQTQIFASFNVVAAGPPATASGWLRAEARQLETLAGALEAKGPPLRFRQGAHEQVIFGVRRFADHLYLVAEQRTTKDQQKALLEAPGLAETYAGLRTLDLLGVNILDESGWRVVLGMAPSPIRPIP